MALSMLNDSDRQLIMEVRELASTHIAERGNHLDIIGDKEPDWVIPTLLAERNLLAPTLPNNYGGRGLSVMATATIIEELAVGCAGAAAIVVTNCYALTPIVVAGSKYLQEQFLPLITQKEPHLASSVINDVASELEDRPESIPEDITRISTTISQQGNQVVINGNKDYIFNGAMADYMVVLARSIDSRHKSRLQFVVIPANTSGVHIVKPVLKIGMRSAHTVRLQYDHVTVPENYRIGRPGGGYFLLLQTFDRNLALVGAIGVGIARSAFELVRDLARQKDILGKNTTANYYFATALADMSAYINAARLSVARAAYQIDQEGNYSRVSAMAKLYATQVAQQVTSQAVDLVGRMGLVVGHPAEKYLRDAQMLSMVAGSDYLHRKTVADQL